MFLMGIAFLQTSIANLFLKLPSKKRKRERKIRKKNNARFDASTRMALAFMVERVLQNLMASSEVRVGDNILLFGTSYLTGAEYLADEFKSSAAMKHEYFERKEISENAMTGT